MFRTYLQHYAEPVIKFIKKNPTTEKTSAQADTTCSPEGAQWVVIDYRL